MEICSGEDYTRQSSLNEFLGAIPFGVTRPSLRGSNPLEGCGQMELSFPKDCVWANTGPGDATPDRFIHGG